MKTLTFLVLVLLAWPSPARAWDPWITTNGEVDRALELSRAGHHQEALAALEEARKGLPESAELHYDLGTVYLGMNDLDNAEKAFKRALETAEGKVRQAALYNLGLVSAQAATQAEASQDTAALAKAKWQEAAEQFRKVAELAPGNQDAVHNLELALLKAFPPCSKLEDQLEPNDSPDAARALPLDPQTHGFKQTLRLCEGNADWFSLPLSEGDRVTATVKPAPEEGQEAPAQPPVAGLYEPDGKQELDGLRREAEGTMKAGPVKVTGSYLLGVTNPLDEGYPYELNVEVLPRCEAIDDAYEPDDTLEAAREVKAGPLEKLRICPGDDDWFRIALQERESLLVVMQAETVSGAPGLEIVDARGQTLSRAGVKDGHAMVAALEPGAGELKVRVAGGADAEAAYSLNLVVVPPCPEGNDASEPNDHAADAKPLEEQKPVLARVCPGDVDLFSYAAPKDQPSVVTARFVHDKGALALDLVGPDGEASLAAGQGEPEADGRAVAVPQDRLGQEVLVRIKGADEQSQNFYLLKVDHPQPNQQNQPRPKPGEQDQQKQDQQQKQQEQPKPEPKEPMENELKKMERNPRNLEAEQALRSSPFRDRQPAKDW
jgi:tetratricopeptide (TPR) repeat protein